MKKAKRDARPEALIKADKETTAIAKRLTEKGYRFIVAVVVSDKTQTHRSMVSRMTIGDRAVLAADLLHQISSR